MSVSPRPGYEVPITTRQVARAAFPKGCLAIRVRDELGELFCDNDFTGVFAIRGRPALSPARLALVSVLQFVEGLTDRQAADAVRGRLDWKYALRLELTDPGFDASVLTEFRVRLIADCQTRRLMNLMLDRLRERGLVDKGGRQRTDATHVSMAVRDLHRLEQVMETLRAALEVLAVAAPAWLAEYLPDGWAQRYGQRADDWRLPKAMQARVDLGLDVGHDGFWLLKTLYGNGCPVWLADLEAVRVLRLTWVQQFHLNGDVVCWRDQELGQPPGALMILSPYDIDARVGIKHGRKWRGYKGHFTETCDPGQPNLIVHVTTTAASTGDVETVAQHHADLAAADLLPEVHLVDAGYVSVDQILAARDQHHVELLGPLPPDTGWQAQEGVFGLAGFHIDWDSRQATCPNGKTSRNWRESYSRQGLPIVQATFRGADCTPCPDRARCTRSPVNARNITFRPRRQYETQRQIRAEQSKPEWRRRYGHRAGVESLMAQASRRSDIHQARYRGLAKTFLQHTLTAMAINLLRINAWLTGSATTGCWTSRLTRLTQATSPT